DGTYDVYERFLYSTGTGVFWGGWMYPFMGVEGGGKKRGGLEIFGPSFIPLYTNIWYSTLSEIINFTFGVMIRVSPLGTIKDGTSILGISTFEACSSLETISLQLEQIHSLKSDGDMIFCIK
ncbi:hypothetical protein ACJX0J_011533, partial [Zea mays]